LQSHARELGIAQEQIDDALLSGVQLPEGAPGSERLQPFVWAKRIENLTTSG
jgi:hypothetical protein